ncbi:MAG: proline dehydrogenase family protein [Bacteroidota bacterium]
MNLINKLVVTILPFIPKPLVRFFAKRYIAGETLSDAARVVTELSKKYAMATIDVLGEDVTKNEEAIDARELCKDVLRMITELKLDANLSVKLTQFGLKLDKEFCYANVREVVELAGSSNYFIWIDMEDHTCTDDTIEIFTRLRKEFTNVGVALQAYLKRTGSDVDKLNELGAGFRLCKGIYIEPEEIALKKKQEVRENFLKLLDRMLSKKAYVGIATHDIYLIVGAKQLIAKYDLQPDKYEFQMLLGVRSDLRDALLAGGHRLRIYVPFGSKWYAYSLRRFKENPEVAGYVFKALFDWARFVRRK